MPIYFPRADFAFGGQWFCFGIGIGIGIAVPIYFQQSRGRRSYFCLVSWPIVSWMGHLLNPTTYENQTLYPCRRTKPSVLPKRERGGGGRCNHAWRRAGCSPERAWIRGLGPPTQNRYSGSTESKVTCTLFIRNSMGLVRNFTFATTIVSDFVSPIWEYPKTSVLIVCGAISLHPHSGKPIYALAETITWRQRPQHDDSIWAISCLIHQSKLEEVYV
jgi:hypothetical protein